MLCFSYNLCPRSGFEKEQVRMKWDVKHSCSELAQTIDKVHSLPKDLYKISK